MEPLLMRVASFASLSDTDPPVEKDNCLVPYTIWRRWIDQQTTEVLLVEVVQNDIRVVLCVEGPHSEESDTMYVPERYFQDFNEEVPLVEVTVLETLPPIATKIVLEPLDQEFEGIDVAAAVSQHLSHWNILKKHTVLSVPCDELAGYPLEVFVKDVEPAELVLLRGEVPLELAEPLQPHQSPIFPVQPMNTVPLPPIDEHTVLDDGNYNFLLPTAVVPGRFVPFSGTGYRLGS